MASWQSFIEANRQQAVAQKADPWRLPLQRLRGKIGADNVERLGTQAILDFLDVPQRNRGAGACRRLAALLRDLGWRPTKARGLNQRGIRETIRGWARDKSGSLLS